MPSFVVSQRTGQVWPVSGVMRTQAPTFHVASVAGRGASGLRIANQPRPGEEDDDTDERQPGQGPGEHLRLPDRPGPGRPAVAARPNARRGPERARLWLRAEPG